MWWVALLCSEPCYSCCRYSCLSGRCSGPPDANHMLFARLQQAVTPAHYDTITVMCLQDAALEESDGGRRLSSTAAPRAGVVSKGSSGTRAEPLTEPVRQRNVVDEMREAGNAAMRTGDYAAAVQHYDRQLQLDPSSYIGYSNRAQAHLGLKDYRLAAQDATSALRLDPTHVKSWVRRATARNHLGMHTLALADLQAALALDPSNKTVLQDLRKTQEHTRAAKRRLPELVLPVGSAT